MTADEIDALVMALPGAERSTAYGEPCWRIAGKFFARLRAEDASLALDVGDRERRDMLVEMEPEVFHLTDHYRAWSYVLIRIAGVDRAWLETELKARWRKVVPAALRKAHPGLT
ncbi:MAG: MmcQ/YjbR family DNA-binding protein [Alphaproteobacteria bacterium]|nr:MmcQ/YjbR family DNA-binding protein [Alphaproteobacteria bacterium]MBU1526220.1 MmcQ/YjbR family DNA-binding protein [Alphaproteobacteria bacterium]MBU2116431.1 MmcQ/YjbR family DNA-binding protein [Alphaproteobacteria bacterium]MBU2351377.1 MmcQ/YjbR family DNA-binding protein [Alphaproteobacteria bacterium]MBU2382101.1 MmcQ/YjbR family DNA-binding protein [Alphaproteobacteria bacterium]